MFALVDCNNFFCSCERVFRPELNQVPVVVLSNNDGCVIARSNESKALGIKMGVPYFQVKRILEKNKVAVFSSNHTLYASLSGRVMSLLSTYSPHMEQYSIDEAFLDFSGMGDADYLKEYGENIVRRIKKATGIPVSIGIAPTKTLAKVASKFAKKYAGYKGCCLIDNERKRQKALAQTPIADVWGIGRQLQKKLSCNGVRTAADFAMRSEEWVKACFSIATVRTWNELRGIACIQTDENPEKKSIGTSRSFPGKGICELKDLEEAVAVFASSCCEKLRRQHSSCRSMLVYAHTNRFHTELPSHVINCCHTFPLPTQDTSEIISAAMQRLRSNYISKDYFYKKVGVLLWDIVSEKGFQQLLFDKINRKKQAKIIQAVDQINARNGRNTVRIAVQGNEIMNMVKGKKVSRNYTTDIHDILVVKA